MQYLKIENPGVAPDECFTMLGVSTSRYSNNSDVIGKFGSGTKHSINLFLRNGLPLYIFCGNTKLEFFCKDLHVNDGLSNNKFNQVCCRFTGKKNDKPINRTEELSWTLENGSLDWNDLAMACREFMSNAIDRANRQEGHYRNVVIEVVEENQVRAKSDHTRIFIPYVPEIINFHQTLGKRFLHFTRNYNSNLKVLDKAGRNVKYTEGNAVIYRRGVYVREMKGMASCFDYNFGDELEIDECRNAGEWNVRDAICKVIHTCDTTKLLNSLPNCFESTLSFETLRYYCQDKEAWKRAWSKTFTPYHILSTGVFDDLLVEKGLKPVIVGDNWYSFLTWCGISCDRLVLSSDQVEGREIINCPHSVQECFYRVWHFLSTNGYTKGKEKPELVCFRQMQPGRKTLGFYKDNKVYLHEDIIGDVNINLKQTILEECVHHITGANDMSRELQEFAFKVIAEKCLS